MEQPQPCTKCKKLPEDILMLACSHDLCLDCASDRLAFELKKKKPANVPSNSLRALSAKFAMNEQHLMQRASLNWRNSSPPIKAQLAKITKNPGNPTIEWRELTEVEDHKSMKKHHTNVNLSANMDMDQA